MAAPIDHRHCKVCGKACGAGEETCSPACYEKRQAMLSSRRLYTGLMYIVIAILVLSLVITFLHP